MSSVRKPYGRLPNSWTGSAKASVPEAVVVHTWHRTRYQRKTEGIAGCVSIILTYVMFQSSKHSFT